MEVHSYRTNTSRTACAEVTALLNSQNCCTPELKGHDALTSKHRTREHSPLEGEEDELEEEEPGEEEAELEEEDPDAEEEEALACAEAEAEFPLSELSPELLSSEDGRAPPGVPTWTCVSLFLLGMLRLGTEVLYPRVL